MQGLHTPLLKLNGPNGPVALTTGAGAVGQNVVQGTATVEFASEADGGSYRCTSDDLAPPANDRLTEDSDANKPMYAFAPKMCSMDINFVCELLMLLW
jgi:hypothetical protein